MQKGEIYKIFANLIIILSLVFLIIYLIRNDQIIWLNIKNISAFIISIFCILFGFIFEGIALRFYLKKESIELNARQSIIATGKYILAKYIPGKIGTIIGKASYITKYTSVSPLIVFQKTFIFQMIVVLASFLISIIPLYTFLSSKANNLIWILSFTLIFLFLVSQKKIQRLFLQLLKKILDKDLGTSISKSTILQTLIILILCFLFWSFGFYLLSFSLGFKLVLNIGFLFPLAAFFGIIIIIAPGGLGIREGIIAAGLIYYGLPKEYAISISAFSRIWFLIGELLIFIIALLLSIRKV